MIAYRSCMTELHLQTRRDGTVDVLTVRGAMTARTAMDLHSQLELLLQRPSAVIVVDLHDVTGCDITAVTVLRAAGAVAVTGGTAIRLARPGPEVCAVLRAAKTMRYLATYGSVDGAVTADPIDLLETPGPAAGPGTPS